MKVAVVNDLPVAGVLTGGVGSGAELSLGRFLWEGHRREHIADVITPEYFRDGILDDYDLVVTKGVTRLSPDQFADVRRRRYVAWPSDYAFYKWRLYFGFQEEAKRNPKLRLWEDYFTGSLLNVFLSPLHRQCYEWAMPKVADHPWLDAPPPVNVDMFHPAKEGWEPNTAASINGLLDFKSLHPSLDYCYAHPELKVTFIGATRDNVNLPPNATYVGFQSVRRLAEIIGRTEIGLELPKTAQPFNRTAVELLLSCKRVVVNNNVGAASYQWFRDADREAARTACRQGASMIWDRLEKEAAS